MTTQGNQEALDAITLSRLPGVGAKTFKTLLTDHQRPSLALKAFLKRRGATPSLDRRAQRKSPTEAGIESARSFLENGGMVLYFGHPDYPLQLAELREPPHVLFILGTLRSEKLIAVIGARKASEAGVHAARSFSSGLLKLGWGIISGGAKGIDAAAHAAALENSGYTAAVLGSGVDVWYPACNKALFEDIARSGAIVSELLPGTKPLRSFFPTRNRIVAGIARAILVIQASEKSGALITANYARAFGRPVFVLVPPPDDESWEGNRRLLAKGAIPVTSIQDLKGEL